MPAPPVMRMLAALAAVLCATSTPTDAGGFSNVGADIIHYVAAAILDQPDGTLLVVPGQVGFFHRFPHPPWPRFVRARRASAHSRPHPVRAGVRAVG